MPALFLRYLPQLIVLAALVGGAWWFSHSRYEAGRAAQRVEDAQAEQACVGGSVCASAADARAKAQALVVADAVKAAQAAQEAQQAAAMAAEQAARGRAEQAASVALVQAQDWRRRYEAAIATSKECKAWADMPVPCPVQ